MKTILSLILLTLISCSRGQVLDCEVHSFKTPKDSGTIYMFTYLDKQTDSLRPFTCVTCGYKID